MIGLSNLLSPFFLLGGFSISYSSYLIGLIGIVFLFLGLYLINKARSIKIEKENEKQEKIRILDEINQLSNSRTELLLAIEKEKQHFKEEYEKEKNNLSEQLEIYKQNIDHAKENYFELLEDGLASAENNYDTSIQQYEYKLEKAEAQLKELMDSLNAGVQAQLREREKEENLQFYKLSISPIDLEDITKLCSLKIALHNPVVLSKLIWTQYFQKQTAEMCNRIFGIDKVCGIYKITNLKTKQCYIGQSINIQDRVKQHIKCGLGIDAPATNKLYNDMQSTGVWNYTFELIEKCKREELDKKEKQWIEIYQSNIYGLNVTKGNH